jgi:DNA-binding NarL/FixJ family response regulator
MGAAVTVAVGPTPSRARAALLGVDDDSLRSVLLEVLDDLGVEVVDVHRAMSNVGVVIRYVERQDVVATVRPARIAFPAAALLVVVPLHDDEQRLQAVAAGADGYHSLDGMTGELSQALAGVLHARCGEAASTEAP